MSELLDTLADKISKPENKAKLTNFLGVVKDVVSSGAKVTVLETGNRFLLSQKEGVVQVTVSKDFLTNMGDFELGVEGSTPFSSNVHFNMSEPVVPPPVANKQADKSGVEFVKTGELYKANVGNGFLEALDDIRMVNLLKRPGIPLPGFNMVKKYLQGLGFTVYVAGEAPVESEPVESAPGTTVVQATPTTEPVLGERIVFKEVPVYVDKIVIKEVPVEVQKVVVKEVPVYIEVKQEKEVEKKHVQFVDVKPKKKKKGPIEEPVEESEEVEESSPEESEEVEDSSPNETEESESGSEETEESEEESEFDEETEEEPPKKVKLKGKWLNPNKTILKSGDFVYRVDKKIDGPTELFAIGRWDKDKQKRVKLRKGDAKIIKKLGNKVA